MACRLLEGDGSSIDTVVVSIYIEEENQYGKICIWMDETGNYQPLESRYSFRSFDIWERLGKAFENTEADYWLRLICGAHEVGVEINEESRRSLTTFFDGLKNNTSVESLYLDLDLYPDSRFPAFDLVHFARNNKNFIDCALLSDEPVTHEQSFVISNMLEVASLETFSIIECNFGISNESAYRRIILACLNVKTLMLLCRTPSQYVALGALLVHPSAVVSVLHLRKNCNEGIASVITSLRHNTTLRKWIIDMNDDDNHLMASVLCDTSSLESIQQSNHTLESVGLFSIFMKVSELLELNENTNKEKVIRTKISRYYFAESFDTSPFAKMPISVVPEVMGMIEGNEQYCCNAIFRVLQGIPDLCNVASRTEARLEYVGASGNSAIKRQKIVKD